MRNRGFWSWGKRLEQVLIRFVVVCAVALVVIQSLTDDDPTGLVIGRIDLQQDVAVSPNAGQPIEPGANSITLYLDDYSSLPKLHILVNGEPVDRFETRYVTFPVREGDLVELDASFYDRPVEVRVLMTSGAVISPEKGEILKAEGIFPVGKVKIESSG